MGEKKRNFGELELLLMKIIDEKGPITIRDTLQYLNKNTRYTTVMTVMNRLVQKGQLKREKRGRQYEYKGSLTNLERPFSLLDWVKKKVFGKQSLMMISYLIETSEEITDSDLAEIEQMIQNAREAKK